MIEHDPVANLKLVEPLFREALGTTANVTFDIDAEWQWAWRARFVAQHAPDREVMVRGALDFYDIYIPEIGVGTQISSVDWGAVDLRGVIRAVAELVTEYLEGNGELESHGPSSARVSTLHLDTSLGEWVLGRNVSITPQEW